MEGQKPADESIDATDPFGLNKTRDGRHRKVTSSFQAYSTPQKDPTGNNITPNKLNGTVPRKPRNTLETASFSKTEESLLASPFTSQSQQQESPASQWNVSHISAQDTLSISPMDNNRPSISNLVLDKRQSSSNASLASQTMQKQLLQLVHSLQSNLDESHEVRDTQVLEMQRLDQTIQALQRQVNNLQNDKQIIEEKLEQEGSVLRKEIENSQREKDEKVKENEELKRKLEQSERNAEENQNALQTIQLEHSTLAQSLAEQIKAKDQIKLEHEKLQEQKVILEQKSQELIEEQRQLQQEHKSLREELMEVESCKTKLQNDTDLLRKERSQVQTLQQHFLEMQNTQVELERKQNEEEERLIEVSRTLDQRAQQLQQQQLEIMEEENKLTALDQKVKNNKIELEKDKEAFEKGKIEFELKLKEMSALESRLQSKAEELNQIETTISEEKKELEKRSIADKAKHSLALEALEEVANKRIAEESRMKTALQNLEEIEQKYVKIKDELKKSEDCLATAKNATKEKLHDLQEQVKAENETLEETKKATESARQKYDREREMAAMQIDDLMDQVDTLQSNIEEEELRKEEILEEISTQETELETLLRYIQSERTAWEEEKNSAKLKHEERMKQRREMVDTEITDCRERAQKEINLMVESTVAKQEIITGKLIEQMDQMEAMQNDIETAGGQWKYRYEKLNADQREYDQKRTRLDQLVLELKSAREEAKAREESVHLERRKLQDLLEKEKKRHQEIILSIQDESDVYLEELRKEHREEIKDQRKMFDSIRGELEDRNQELQQHLLEQQTEKEKTILKLQDENSKYQSDLAVARNTIDVSQKELKFAQQQIAEFNTVGSSEREKMRLLMERLESSNLRLEVQEKTVSAREKELEKQREENIKQMNIIEDSKRNVEERMRSLQQQESALLAFKADLEGKEVEVGKSLINSKKKLCKVAVRNLISKSWREDKELVSAAFSKWLRVTMVESSTEADALNESIEEDLKIRLSEVNHESQLKEDKISKLTSQMTIIKTELAASKESNSKLAKTMDDLYHDLNNKKEALRLAEDKIKKKEEEYNAERLLLTNQIEADKERLLVEQKELSDQRKLLEQDRAALAEKNVAMEKRKAESGGSMEQKMLLEQRKMADETAKNLILKEREISAKTERIREAEKRVQDQEDKVLAEAAEFRSAQARVRKLAEQLQEREKLIEEREKETELSQSRVLIMAQKLQEKDQAIQDQKRQLESKMKDIL